MTLSPKYKALHQAVIKDRQQCLAWTDLIPDSRYPLFEETTLHLIELCQVHHPQTILDTGTGITSVLLRKYNPTAHVVSVDNNDVWLEKTQEMLRRSGFIRNGQLLSWKTFLDLQQRQPQTFDLISHDMGNMATRLITLPKVLNMLKPQGAVLLDNLGCPGYKEYAIPLMYYHRFHSLHPTNPETLTGSNAGDFGTFIRL